ncbi:MAG: hypothetical protein M3P49_14065 [Actinomycetota bacterium]|nr:hypothetical protein [Actinomycetota bacterium]
MPVKEVWTSKRSVSVTTSRGVLKFLAVEEELRVGGGEILVTALVLEGEESLAPHVGEALAPAPPVQRPVRIKY